MPLPKRPRGQQRYSLLLQSRHSTFADIPQQIRYPLQEFWILKRARIFSIRWRLRGHSQLKYAPAREEHSPSDRANVLGARSLGTTAFDVRDALSFLQFVEGATFNVGHVEEHIGTMRGLDEAEALVRDALNRSFRHSNRVFPYDHTGKKSTRSFA